MPAKTALWTPPAVVGLILAVIGLLVGAIGLRPQLSANPQAERANNQPFSAPFEITNNGYIGFHVDYVTVIFPYVQYPGDNTFNDAVDANADWNDFDLDRGDSKTVYPYFANGRPEKANMVIAVDFRYLGIKKRKLFRFEGTYMDNWEWSKQPIDNEVGYDKVVDDELRREGANDSLRTKLGRYRTPLRVG